MPPVVASPKVNVRLVRVSVGKLILEREKIIEASGSPDRHGSHGNPPLIEWRQNIEKLLDRPSESPRWVVVGLVVFAAVVGGALLVRRQSTPPEVNLPMADSAFEAKIASSTTTTLPELVVHAAGAVNRPGVYRLPPSSRVVDLVERAGGPSDSAQLERLNLAAPLVDGSRIYVPRKGESDPGLSNDQTGSAGASAANSVLDLNTATAEQLDGLPGIGPSTAKKILDERKRVGRFRSVEDLLEVRGIGEAKLSDIRSLVRV